MRFEASEESRRFAESVRAAIGPWEPAREPDLGVWQDDRDELLARRLVEVGWADLASDPELLGPAVAGGVELGRACAPVCLLDEATLGAPLWVEGRARHGAGAAELAAPRRGGGLVLGAPRGAAVPERTLDGCGTVRVELELRARLPAGEAAARWASWSAATLGYLAGVAARSLEMTVQHVQTREQFGAPLARLPVVRARLADAALAVDAIELVAWQATDGEPALATSRLGWATDACREVTAAAHQLHGALGFALESGIHRWHRRAWALHAWSAAALAALR